jgi:UDP-N-acetyl-D-mannosaminuronic acid dehydrogenase
VKVAKTLPECLQLKPEEVDTPEKRAKFTVSIIGCGLRGIFYAITFAEAGFKVICVDADQSTIKRISKGIVPLAGRDIEIKLKGFVRTEKLTASSELKKNVSQSDIIIITINTKVDTKKNTDSAEVISCCKQVGAALQKGSLIVYGGVVSFGFTEGVIKETLEDTSGLKLGEDFGLAYIPLQSSVFQSAQTLGTQEVMIAALDKTSLTAATTIFGAISKKIIKTTMNIKTAELATLFQATRHDTNVALANELAVFCETLGVDYSETQKLVSDGYETCLITPTISEDTQNEAFLLQDSAEALNIKLRLPPLARQINEDMVKHAVNLTQDALRIGDKTLRRARIAILGTANSRTTHTTFIDLLEAKGAKIIHFDPQSSENTISETGHMFKKTINETVEGTDCVVVLSEQDQLKRLNLKKLRAIMKSPAAIIDLTGTIEPNKAQEEGFTYRGLGKGAWKK